MVQFCHGHLVLKNVVSAYRCSIVSSQYGSSGDAFPGPRGVVHNAPRANTGQTELLKIAIILACQHRVPPAICIALVGYKEALALVHFKYCA
jgi:hypothetical protein